MRLDSLQDLFALEMKDLYSAERQIIDALPKMTDAAGHPELRRVLEDHLEVTRDQVQRIEQICDDLGIDPKGHKCKGMEGLIRQAREVIEEEGDPDVLDAGIIGQAQRVEHYEIAGYGTARAFAERLGFTEAARMLQQTLDEEGDADHRLTDLAERMINPDAAQGGGMRA